MSDDYAIHVENLRKTYRDGWFGWKRFTALDGVTLSVQRGEIFGLLGPNGAGKTTLIKCLLGIIRKSGGDGSLLGQRMGSQISRRKIGYLPEHLRLPRHHNGYAALDYYGGLSGLSRAEIRGKRQEILELVGLADRAQDSVRKYSKGMVQRLGLAQALLHDPELVFLDEPTDGLDPLGRSQVRQALLAMREMGKTVFLNSHILQEVELICDRVAILHKGKLVKIGAVDEVSGGSSEELQIVVQADAPRVQEALNGQEFAIASTNGETLTLSLRPEQQSDVDQAVDRLRDNGVSIIKIDRRRLSLEEAFVDIVQTYAAEEAS